MFSNLNYFYENNTYQLTINIFQKNKHSVHAKLKNALKLVLSSKTACIAPPYSALDAYLLFSKYNTEQRKKKRNPTSCFDK